MSLLQGFPLTSQGTQGYRNNEFSVAHRLRNFYGKNAEVVWLFQLVCCLVVFFLIWIRVAELGRRRQWHPTPVLLPGKSHGQRSLVGCSPWVAKSRTRLSDFIFTFHFHALETEMATHSSVLAWRIPGTGEPGGLPSMGSHRVGHD